MIKLKTSLKDNKCESRRWRPLATFTHREDEAKWNKINCRDEHARIKWIRKFCSINQNTNLKVNRRGAGAAIWRLRYPAANGRRGASAIWLAGASRRRFRRAASQCHHWPTESRNLAKFTTFRWSRSAIVNLVIYGRISVKQKPVDSSLTALSWTFWVQFDRMKCSAAKSGEIRLQNPENEHQRTIRVQLWITFLFMIVFRWNKI